MFKRLNAPSGPRVRVDFEGQSLEVPSGETVAAALLIANAGYTRTTPISGSPRAPLCLMGVCFECLVVIDGQPNQRACQTIVYDSMVIRRQYGSGETPA
jgi:predicted molibdopterin-dependent oxidoreductase YjgC